MARLWWARPWGRCASTPRHKPTGSSVLAIARHRERDQYRGDHGDRTRGDAGATDPAVERPARGRRPDGEDERRDHRRQGKVHPPLRAHFGRDRHDARGGRERQEEPETEVCDRAPPAYPRRRHHREQGDDHRSVRQGHRQRDRLGAAVVENERVRPDRQLQVGANHHGLVEQVGPRGDPGAEAGAPGPWCVHDEEPEHEPCGGQSAIQRRAFPESQRHRAGREHRVVEQHQHRGRHHDLLAGHPGRAREDRSHAPSRGMRAPVHAPDRTVEREQVEQPHHRLGPLRDVVDHLGLERVDQPEERDGRSGQPRAHRIVAARRQRPADDPEQHEGREHEHPEVPHPERGGGEAALRVAEGERQADERAPRDRTLCRRAHRLREGPERGDVGVLLDRVHVVEDEGRVQAVGVGEDARRDQQQRRSGDSERGAAGCRGGRFGVRLSSFAAPLAGHESSSLRGFAMSGVA